MVGEQAYIVGYMKGQGLTTLAASKRISEIVSVVVISYFHER